MVIGREGKLDSMEKNWNSRALNLLLSMEATKAEKPRFFPNFPKENAEFSFLRKGLIRL